MPQGRQAGPGLPWLVILPPWACWSDVLARVNTALWRERPDLLPQCKAFTTACFSSQVEVTEELGRESYVHGALASPREPGLA